MESFENLPYFESIRGFVVSAAENVLPFAGIWKKGVQNSVNFLNCTPHVIGDFSICKNLSVPVQLDRMACVT